MKRTAIKPRKRTKADRELAATKACATRVAA
jgi:hypothetical protein